MKALVVYANNIALIELRIVDNYKVSDFELGGGATIASVPNRRSFFLGGPKELRARFG